VKRFVPQNTYTKLIFPIKRIEKRKCSYVVLGAHARHNGKKFSNVGLELQDLPVLAHQQV